MRIRTLILAAALVAAAAPAVAGSHDAPISSTMTARDAGSAQWFFAMAPDDVLPLLPANTRLDMLDYFNSGVDRASRNAAGSEARILSSADRRITFVLGDSTTCEIGVFISPADTAVALVETLRFPMADSRISWYDGAWAPRKAPVDEPRLADWLTADGRRQRTEVEREIPFLTAVITTDPETRTVTYTRTIDSYFLPSERPASLGLLQPRLQLKLGK